jgi:hypothetical protein
MKYIVIELQKTADGSIANIATAYDTLNQAYQKFHQVLAYAAVSNLPVHACTMLDETGMYVDGGRFVHETEVATNG